MSKMYPARLGGEGCSGLGEVLGGLDRVRCESTEVFSGPKVSSWKGLSPLVRWRWYMMLFLQESTHPGLMKEE